MSQLLASVLAVVEREADAVNLGQPGIRPVPVTETTTAASGPP